MRTMIYACSPLAVICLTLASCGGGTSETPSSSASTEIDPCTLLTAAEIEATMGVVPGEMERPESFSCQWPNPGSPFPVAYIGVSTPNIGSWEEYRAQMLEEGFGNPDADLMMLVQGLEQSGIKTTAITDEYVIAFTTNKHIIT